MTAQFRHERRGQHGHAVTTALAVAHQQFATRDIDVFHAQPDAFHQPQAGSIEQSRHHAVHAVHMRKHAPHFVDGQDDR
jgi:hypothetical protein